VIIIFTGEKNFVFLAQKPFLSIAFLAQKPSLSIALGQFLHITRGRVYSPYFVIDEHCRFAYFFAIDMVL